MIITKLIGGLGNQMFQYAAAKSLALTHHVICKVDTTALNSTEAQHTKRNFELNIFDAEIEIASDTEIKQFINNKTTLFLRIINKFFPSLIKNKCFLENGHQYNTAFLSYPKKCYLEGFWQSELYFKNHENEIKKTFTFHNSIIQLNSNLATQINNCRSVSVHVRRGDYVTNSSANQFHGLCTIEYYQKAIDYLKHKSENIVLFIFSDDINWCKENFKFNIEINFIETNNPHSDLYLMTQCKHNIIANSSFSWWGAWLNNNINKIVIAPKNWFSNTTINTNDIIPRSWIKL